jgi:hypothetical protein
MAKRTHQPQLIVAGLFLATMAAVHFAGRPSRIGAPGIALELPAAVGRWKGERIRFCHKETCLTEVLSSETHPANRCPKCDEPLHDASLGEQQTLPKDALLLKRRYTHPDGRSIFVSIVVTGTDRAGIHRPEWCLPAQGYVIRSSRVVTMPLPGREPLSLSLLHAQSERNRGLHVDYAYWFVGRDREVARHIQRLYWMAMDNVFRNLAHRWAYIALSSPRVDPTQPGMDTFQEFIAEFYPLIRKD